MIHLFRPGVEMLDAALTGDAALADALGHDVAPGWATFRGALRPAREALAIELMWGARFFVTDEPLELVGWGGFKGRPRDGVVEVGYEIAQARQGRGYATAVTRAMVAEAFAAGVRTVIAHTLPERNASGRVLEKAGFVLDPDQPTSGRSVSVGGRPVWRYVARQPIGPATPRAV